MTWRAEEVFRTKLFDAVLLIGNGANLFWM